MPLTDFQASVARLLASNRSCDRYLAGGAAIHIEPNTLRYSNDLDYFHDSEALVSEAFENDRTLLAERGFKLAIDLQMVGYVRAVVSSDADFTKVEWAQDSAWRFMPTIRHEEFGFLLHPIDLATNKVLTLAGRAESRDFLDVLHFDQTLLGLGATCWAAVGKDPGFSPLSLLELLRRRGKYRPEDFAGLMLTKPIDLPALKSQWLHALERAEDFIRERPPSEVGCLYYDGESGKFVSPTRTGPDNSVPHYGRPGGVLPQIA